MTNILALGEDVRPCAVSTNEDWIDGLAFSFGGAPLAIDAISFRMQVRKSASDRQVFLDASTDNGLLKILPSTPLVTPLNPGAGYAIGDILHPAGGVCTVAMSFAVTDVQLVSFTVSGSGPGFAPGNTIALGGGVAATVAVVTVDSVDQTGHILTAHVSTPGSYTLVPASFTQGVTNGNGTGATFANPIWGVAAAIITDPGIYSVLPTNPLAQASTTGSGVGATFTMTLVNNGLAILIPAASLPLALVAGSYVFAIRAQADGYTSIVTSGPLTVTAGIVQ